MPNGCFLTDNMVVFCETIYYNLNIQLVVLIHNSFSELCREQGGV